MEIGQLGLLQLRLINAKYHLIVFKEPEKKWGWEQPGESAEVLELLWEQVVGGC